MKLTPHYKVLFASAVLLMTLPGISQADHPDNEMQQSRCEHHGMHGEHKMRGGLHPFLKGVDLSSEQKTKIKALMEAEKPEMKAQHEKRHELMKEMSALASEESFDEAKAENIANSLGTLEKEIALKRIYSGNKVLSILTPEQRAQALDNIKKHMGKTKAEQTSYDFYKQKLQSFFTS